MNIKTFYLLVLILAFSEASFGQCPTGAPPMTIQCVGCQPINAFVVVYCKGQDSVILFAPTGFSRYEWFNVAVSTSNVIDTNRIYIRWSGNLNSGPNNYMCKAYDAGNTLVGCGTFIFSNLDAPSAYSVPPSFPLMPDKFICQGEQDSMTGTWTAANIFLWNTGATTRTIPVDTAGTYIVRMKGSHPCPAFDTAILNVFEQLLVSAGNDTAKCATGTVTLNAQILTPGGASPPVNYNWSPAAGLSSTAIPNPIASPTSTTQYRLIVSDSRPSNCNRDTAFVTVAVGIPVIVNIPVPDSTICSGKTIQLQSTVSGGFSGSGYTFDWLPTGGLSNPSISNPVASPLVNTRYVVRVEDSIGCFGRDSIQINVNQLSVNINPPNAQFLCREDSVQLNTTASGGQSPYQFLWNRNPPDLSDNTISNPIARGLNLSGATNFIVTATDANGCNGLDTIIINRLLPPIVNLNPVGDTVPPEQTTVISSTVTSTNGNNIVYSWTPVDGFISGVNTAAITFFAEFSLTGTTRFYTLIVRDDSGCVSDPKTAFILVGEPDSLLPKNVIFVPRYFSPNATQETNRTLKVYGTFLSREGFSFIVYNRWGQIIYEATDLEQATTDGWNGKLNNTGGYQVMGAYTFVLRGRFINGETFSQTGKSNLIE